MIKTVVSTALPVDERLLIKKNVIRHGNSNKRICIVTGTHGDELEGQYVCFRLNQIVQQNLEKLNGTVEIYPALNPLGIDSITRGIPGFDLDMNRIFPGNPDGTMTEQVAYTLLRDLHGKIGVCCYIKRAEESVRYTHSVVFILHWISINYGMPYIGFRFKIGACCYTCVKRYQTSIRNRSMLLQS